MKKRTISTRVLSPGAGNEVHQVGTEYRYMIPDTSIGTPEQVKTKPEGWDLQEKSEPADEETEEVDEAALEEFVGQVEDVLSKPTIGDTKEPADAATNQGKKIRSMMSDALGKLDEIEKSLTRTVPITKE
ncbi:MAG: hypothetical protein ACFFH0_05630, partial [Promethearchaeota archaeon]